MTTNQVSSEEIVSTIIKNAMSDDNFVSLEDGIKQAIDAERKIQEELRGEVALKDKALDRAVEACKQAKQRIENFETGFKSVGEPSTPFQLHVMVTLNAIKQDIEEALNANR